MASAAGERLRSGPVKPAAGPEPKDRDEPGPEDRERLDRDERETFADDAMRERDA
jgi:hypothetical protein